MTEKISSINAIQRIEKVWEIAESNNVDHGCGHSLVSASVMVFVLEGSGQHPGHESHFLYLTHAGGMMVP
jgi:hypothetical protein